MGNQYTGKIWTQEEDIYLAKVFPTTDSAELVEIFCCSLKVIQNRAFRLKIFKDKKWLRQFRKAKGMESYKKGRVKSFSAGHVPWNKGSGTSRPKKTSTLTGNGYQDVQTVPGGRIIVHRISDETRRA